MNAPAKARIAVTRDGPYIVTGGVPLLRLAAAPDPGGEWAVDTNLPPRQSYALCRCGRSRMSPFCDYKHMQGRFDGTETAERAATRAGEDRAAPSIGFAATGPLFVRGAVDVVSADGFSYPTSAPLCRCGASSTKPFCDGSHDGPG